MRNATITAASFIALPMSQFRILPRIRFVGSGAMNSITIATTSGRSDTSEKKSQSTTYCAVLGFISEMSFSAMGMNVPGIGEGGAGSDDCDER